MNILYCTSKIAGCTTGQHGTKEIMLHPWFLSGINWRRMAAGKVDPPFVPDPHAVYAKDVIDIDKFSSVKDVSLDQIDNLLYQKFNTGAVSIAWQEEIIESGIFDELNAVKSNETTASELEQSSNNHQKSILHWNCLCPLLVVCPFLFVSLIIIVAVTVSLRT